MSWKFEWFQNGVTALPHLLTTWETAVEDHGTFWQCPDIVHSWEQTVAKARNIVPYLLVAENSMAQSIIYPLYVRTETICGVDCSVIEPTGGALQLSYQDPIEAGDQIDRDQRILFWRELRPALRRKFGLQYEFNAYRLLGTRLDAPHTWSHNTATFFINLKGTKCLEEFLSRRGRKLKKHVKGGVRRLREMGCTSLTRIPDSEIQRHMSKFFEIYNQQWGREGRAHAFQRPEIREFWTLAAEKAAALKKLHFSALMVKDEPWSYHLGFEHRGVLLWCKPTYDISHQRHSPGTLHLALAIQDCIERGVQRLDLGWGTQPYKFRWADEQIPLYSLRIHGGMVAVFHRLLRGIRGRAARLLSRER